jgi:hypothetical protein
LDQFLQARNVRPGNPPFLNTLFDEGRKAFWNFDPPYQDVLTYNQQGNTPLDLFWDIIDIKRVPIYFTRSWAANIDQKDLELVSKPL